MDGVLIDSEPLWQQAEAATFATVGVTLTPAMMVETMGMRIDAVVAHWHARFPWETPTQAQVRDDLLAAVAALIAEQGQPLPGLHAALAAARGGGRRVALASSSPLQLITATVSRLGIAEAFEVLHSAESEPYGKPHPAVYLTTADKLGVPPRQCVAIEDSVNGVIAAKAAGMKCIAIPEANARNDRRFGVADVVLPSLAAVTEELLGGLV